MTVAKKVTHPKYSEMIATAIEVLKEKRGSSRLAILKYITGKYNVGDNSIFVNSQLKIALKKGVAESSLTQVKGTGASGSFKLKAIAKSKTAANKSPKLVKPKTAKLISKSDKVVQSKAAKSTKKANSKPDKVVKTKSSKSPKTASKKPIKLVKTKSVKSPKKATKVAKKVGTPKASKSPKKVGTPKASKSPKKVAKKVSRPKTKMSPKQTKAKKTASKKLKSPKKPTKK